MSTHILTDFAKNEDVFGDQESAVRSYARAFPAMFDYARGAEIWDVHGRRYLDFLAGCGSLNYGHNHPALKKALVDYLARDSIAHGLDLQTVAKGAFLHALRDLILEPRGLDYVAQFTGPTGANAVEAAMKIARKVTGRSNIISFTAGFHGVSVGALSATGNRYFREAAGVALQGTTVMPYDGYFGDEIDTIEILERMLDDPSSGVDRPAAAIVEAVQGEGGLNVARYDWLRRLQALCQERDMLLIIDDIQAGCGRTGTFFSFEPARIVPDIVTLSKSLSGFGLPFSLVLLRRDLDVWQPGEHNGTFRGNNHAFVTAKTMLEVFWRGHQFEDEIHAKSIRLRHRLEALKATFPHHLGEVRGRGMMQGVRCIDPACAAEVTAKAFEHGLIIERAGPLDEIVKCMMPLTIPETQMEEGLDILEQAMSEVFTGGGSLTVEYLQPRIA